MQLYGTSPTSLVRSSLRTVLISSRGCNLSPWWVLVKRGKWLEGTAGAHPVQPLCSKQDQLKQFARTVLSWVLNISWDSDSTTSLSSLSQCLATLIINKFYLVFESNLLYFRISGSVFFTPPHAVFIQIYKLPLEPSLLESTWPQGPNLHMEISSWSLAFKHWSEMRRKSYFSCQFTNRLGPCGKRVM